MEYLGEEKNALERSAARSLADLVEEVKRLEARINDWDDAPTGSRFHEDFKLAPAVASYRSIKILLSGSAQCFMTLEQILEIVRKGNELSITARPYGSFAPIRNAMEFAAAAVWIMQPEPSKKRVERILAHELDDAKYAGHFFTELGDGVHKADAKRQRIFKYASDAEIKTVREPQPGKNNPHNKGIVKYPGMTELLRGIESSKTARSNFDLTWLAAWQLCSGFAHGKMWATLTAGEVTPQLAASGEDDGTRIISTSFQSLLSVSIACVTMIEAGVERYEQLMDAS